MADKLFQLIKSLSKQEKRYYKLFAEKNRESSNYIKLFDFLSKQKVYNEKKTREYFSNDTFIKQLHVTKNHLYNQILKALSLYHSSFGPESKVKELLNCVEILYHKGLYSQCNSLLEKVEKIATENDLHLAVIEMIDWQSKIAFIASNLKDLEEFVNSGYNKETKILNILENKSKYRKLFYEILILNNRGIPIRNHLDSMKYEIITNNPLVQNEDFAISYYSKIMLYHIHSYYNLNKGDIIQSNKYCEQIVVLMEQNPDQIRISPIQYVAALNNYIYSSIHSGKYEQSMHLICKLKNVCKDYNLSHDLTIDLNEKIFIRSAYLELELYKESYEFDKAIILIETLKLKSDYLFSIPVNRYKIFLLYNISYTYFILSDYTNALYWINNVLNITETKEPVDIFCFARILNILIHYELNNFSAIEYLHQSNIRFFKKRNRLYKFELVIFNFIKKTMIIKAHEVDLINDYKNLKKELQRILKSHEDKKALQYFDYLSWVDSKINNMRMDEYLKLT
jgi:hypothetical protein